jgi:hypothetical protein
MLKKGFYKALTHNLSIFIGTKQLKSYVFPDPCFFQINISQNKNIPHLISNNFILKTINPPHTKKLISKNVKKIAFLPPN